MKRINFIFALLILIAAIIMQPNGIYAQELRNTVIDAVLIENDTLPESKWNNIILSTDDMIEIHYHCEADDGAVKNAFLFRYILLSSIDTSNRVVNRPEFGFQSLPENDYRLEIRAFDPRGEWAATSAFLDFTVNDRLASMKKLADSLNIVAAVKDSIAASLQEEQKAQTPGGELYLYIALALLVLVVILIALLLRRRKPAETPEKSDEEIITEYLAKNNMTTSPENLKDELGRLKKQNSNLRAELAALRGQIDAMQSRGSELQEQNKSQIGRAHV